MLTRTKLFLSAAIVLGTASMALAGQNQANEAALSRVPAQQDVVAPDAYAMASRPTHARATHARRGTVANGIPPILADRQSAWYRL